MTAYQLPIVAIDAVPLIALESMNATHLEEVEVINQLGALIIAALDGESNESLIEQKLDEWMEHTRIHFATENRLMAENGFPAYQVHSGEHEQVFAQMETLCNQWKSGGELQQLADYLFVTWPNWFNIHVNTMDMVTAQFLSIRLQ